MATSRRTLVEVIGFVLIQPAEESPPHLSSQKRKLPKTPQRRVDVHRFRIWKQTTVGAPINWPLRTVSNRPLTVRQLAMCARTRLLDCKAVSI